MAKANEKRRSTRTQDIGHLGVETSASKHSHDKTSADNSSVQEMAAYQKLHAKELLSSELSKAKEEYSKRDHHGSTRTQDIGHLGVETSASKHSHDKMSADNSSVQEMAAYNNAHAKELVSTELESAKEAWGERMRRDQLKRHSTGVRALADDESQTGVHRQHPPPAPRFKTSVEIEQQSKKEERTVLRYV